MIDLAIWVVAEPSHLVSVDFLSHVEHTNHYIGKLFVDTGIVTIACFVSPTIELRQMARDIIGGDDFREVYIATPLEECERRDVKGLYARARRGEVKEFTGISAPFEAPANPDLSLDTSQMTLKEEVEAVVQLITNR